MARPYASEMARLSETFAWAAGAEIGQLRRAVRTAGLSPLRAIGSGGSLSAAHALAAFHQSYTGQLSAVATPLEATHEPLDSAVSTWLLSAGGSNVDIVAAARELVEREPRQLAVMCGRDDSPLAELCRAHPYTDLLVFAPPAGKDGFLATNSLLGFSALLARAYAAEFGDPQLWAAAAANVHAALDEEALVSTSWRSATDALWARPTTVVLYGPSTRVGAVDLESKFTEAAIGNLHAADYRNFAHGRHHWLAKRADTTGVLALVSEPDRALTDRTLALIPSDIPQARIELAGNAISASLLSLVAALQIAGWAGSARGIDPGRPGVPDFGRKLYNLPLPRRTQSYHGLLSSRDVAAIARKAGVSLSRVTADELAAWKEALSSFRRQLWEQQFRALILDYDGTIVDTRERFRPPTQEMAAELVRLLEAETWIAIATGRGASVRRELQTALPRSLWDHVLVGYYNGAEIASLAEDRAPDGTDTSCQELAALALALREQPELKQAAKQTNRRYQITLEATKVLPENRLWDLAHEVILALGASNVSVTRSSHSVDLVRAGVSKQNVVKRLREEIGEGSILAIGDRGLWPGNDYDLLREPCSLSVDEVSIDPSSCWNLAPAGQRGMAVTLEYFRALGRTGSYLRFVDGALQ